MTIKQWYLDIKRLPTFPAGLVDYIESLKPYEAVQWDITTPLMNEYKASLLTQLIEIQGNRCTYCGLGTEHTLIDREHFVHKSQGTGKPEFMFNLKNLFAACAYCNRRIKGQRQILATYSANYEDCTFTIVHPFLDVVDREIEFLEDREGQHILAKAITEKGQKTIDFFKLAGGDLTAKRAGYIYECERKARMQVDDYAELKNISRYKPA